MSASKPVDRLIVIADRENAAPRAGQQLQPPVLQHVRVLEFVHQDVAEALLVMAPQRLVARQQLVAAQQQLGEVDQPFALALALIRFEQFHPQPVAPAIDLHLARAQPGFLGAIDEHLKLARRAARVVHAGRFQHPLDRCQLVLRIQDLEALGQLGVAMVKPQQPIAQPVKRSDPHRTRVDRQHRTDAVDHLARGLVGEGDRQDLQRAGVPAVDQPGDPGRQHARLAAARARQHEHVPGRFGHRRQLLRIKTLEKALHGAHFKWSRSTPPRRPPSHFVLRRACPPNCRALRRPQAGERG